MPNNRLFAAALAWIAMALPAFAQQPSLLVETDWLSQHLNDRNLVVLHVGNRSEYDAGHIPGARFVSQDDVVAAHDQNNQKELMLELPPLETLRTMLAARGISDDSRIVVYFGRNGGLPSATRVIFTLDYVGLGDRTSLLNGGLAAWQRAGQAVTSAAPTVVAGTLSPKPPKNVVVDAEFVKSVGQRPGHTLVDARAPVFYQGIQPTMNNVSGHIPGAVNVPFTEVTDSEMRVDRTRLEGLFRKAGIKPGDTVVAYCHIGQQATAVVFAARLLGHPVVMYDGAFQDWAVNNRGPVEK